MLIRLARQGDLPAIVDIYNQAIQTRQSTGDMQTVQVEERRVWFAEHTPGKYPIYASEEDGLVVGWCSLSPYRPGRAAFRFTAEISYYIAFSHHQRGLGTALVRLEGNTASIKLLEKLGFEQWGYLPRVADFDGREVSHLYYGRHV
jgi:phosphinothricin acetyltransferase